MPRDPTIATPNWAGVFADARDFESWLALAERPEQRERIERGVETFEPCPLQAAAVAAIARPVHVLVIAESWCPDVHRHVPVLERLARCSPAVRVRYLLLGDDPELLRRHLTCGGEAVPKMVFFSADFVECGEWGPMPADCRQLIARGRACGDLATARKLVSRRYAADPQRLEPQREIVEHLWIAATPGLAGPDDEA